jgi:RNA methyltransferase, TrmH family
MFNLKQLKSLHLQKNRLLYGMFLAEGIKTVSDIMSLGYMPEVLLYTEDNNIPNIIKKHGECVPQSAIDRISTLKTPPPVLAVFKKFYDEYQYSQEKSGIQSNDKHDVTELINSISGDYILFLDDISDPGNLGTIIRTADWFGFKNIICSNNTVEMYNPKVVQATMGAIANVNIYYVDARNFLHYCNKSGFPVLGTFMEGNDLSTFKQTPPAVIIIGNEANGISKDLYQYLTDKISIPSYDHNGKHISESLNAAISCGIICREFRVMRFA